MSGQDVYISFAADTGPLEASFSLARAQSQALSRELNALGRQMQSVGASADGELGQRLNALGSQLAQAKGHMAELSAEMRAQRSASSGVAEEVGGLLARFRQFTEGITGLHESFSSAAETFAAAFAVDKLKEFIDKAAETGEAIDHMAHFTGQSVEEVQRLQGMARIAGLDIDDLTRGLARMNMQLEATGANSRPAKALEALNINVQQFKSLDFVSQLNALAEAYGRTADGTEKAAATMALMRTGGDSLVAFLDRGKAGLADLNAKMTEIGVSSAKDVAALNEIKEAENELVVATDKLGRDLVSALKTPILAVIGWLDGLINVLRETAAQINAVLSVLQALNSYRMTDEQRLAAAGDISTDATLGGNINVNAKPKVGQLREGGGRTKNTAGAEAREAFSDEIDAAKRAATEAQDILNNEVKEHKISWSEWAKDSIDALEKEKAAVQAAGTAALASTALTSVQKQEIMRKEADVLAEIAKKERDDQAKAVEEIQKSWEALGKTIEGAINSQLKSVSTGTESWKTGMVKALEEVALKLVEIQETNLTKGISDQLSSTFGDVGSAITSVIANAIKGIAAGAGETAAGVSGFLAPVLGPAAVPAGIAAGTAIFSAAKGIGMMDIGAWNVPSDMPAMIHRNELVMPAAEAGAFRSVLSGLASGQSGGGSTHTHYHSGDVNINGTGLEPREIARQVAQHWNRDASIRPKY